MNLVYCALALHSAGKEINEENLKKMTISVGEKVDESRIKALVSALEGVDIDEAIRKTAMPVMAAAPVAAEKKEEKPSEEELEKKAESAAEGLSSLFG